MVETRAERALHEVDEIRDRIDAHRPLSPALVSRIQALLLPELLWASDALGSREALSLMETRRFLESEVVSGGHPLEAFLQLQRHRTTWELVEQRAREGGALEVEFVRAVHQSLVSGARGEDPRPGQWKRTPSPPTRRRGRTFEYAAPEAVAGLMDRLAAGLAARREAEHPVAVATWLYYHFHLIHPFEGMNGQMARLLATCVLTSRGYPPLVLLPEDLGDYLDALATCQSTTARDEGGPLSEKADLTALVELFSRCLVRTARRLLDVIEGRELAPSELPGAVAESQEAAMQHLLRSPDTSWRVRGGVEVRALFARLLGVARQLAFEGPLYGIVVRSHRASPTHELVLGELGARLPSGDAGLMGELTMAIEPNRTAVGVRFPEPQRLQALVASSQLGLQLLLHWSGDAEVDVHHGPPEAAAWSQVELERALTRCLDRRRRGFEMLLLDRNLGPGETLARLREQLRTHRAARPPAPAEPAARTNTPLPLPRPGDTRRTQRTPGLRGQGLSPSEPPVSF